MLLAAVVTVNWACRAHIIGTVRAFSVYEIPRVITHQTVHKLMDLLTFAAA